MAKSGSTKLTKFVSATTIVTADVANMWYGGLFGSSEGAACDVDDPLVAGHVHDGSHQDGHAQKIHLVDHVTSQLTNPNLADDAVVKRNVQAFLDVGSAIPEYEDIDGGRYYYLDLSIIRSEFSGGGSGAFLTTAGVTSNSPGDLNNDDFVFGSDSLDYDADANHYNRIIFDKNIGAFRAGTAEGIMWDESNRGAQSVGFGRNNVIGGSRSSILGGETNLIVPAGVRAVVGAGTGNGISSADSGILSGNSNLINDDSSFAFIGAGEGNIIYLRSTHTAIVSGDGNIIRDDAPRSSIVGGRENDINALAADSFIGGGQFNQILASSYNSIIVGGTSNTIGDGTVSSYDSVIVGGSSSDIDGFRCFIGGGTSHVIDGVTLRSYNTIVGGRANSITESDHAFIGGGRNNSIVGTFNTIGGGQNNSILDSCSHNFIGGGGSVSGNEIKSSSGGLTVTDCAIVGGHSNIINNTDVPANGVGNFIGAGHNNYIGHSIGSAVVGGVENDIFDHNHYNFIGSGRGNQILDGVNSVICGGGYTGGPSNGNIIDSLSGSEGMFIGSGRLNLIDGTNTQYSSIISGSGNNISSVSNSTVLNGTNVLANLGANHSISSGLGTWAKSFGERVHSSGLINGIAGSAQDSALIWRALLQIGQTGFRDLYLDGASGVAYIPDNSCYYITCEVIIANVTSPGEAYGFQESFLVYCNGVGTLGSVSSSGRTAACALLSAGSWNVVVGATGNPNEWGVLVVADGEADPFTSDFHAVCVTRAVETALI
jgi:hypothetical protein